ncbi:MAG TPA: hypothetical protein VKO45_05530 [Methanomicrobiales archaeon]|nr:hypothetical protein [Methanomicrobiales archaeon]
MARKETDPAAITRDVVEALELPDSALPILSRTVARHLRAMEREEG